MAVQGAKYEEFKIRSADGERVVDLYDAQFRVNNIYYYESILSPQITGIITITSTTGVTSGVDIQERSGSLHNSLPLEVGCEILLKIKYVIGNGIDFSSRTDPRRRLYINEIQVIDKSSNSEIIQLRFTSRIGVTNVTRKVTRYFDGRISESVKNILKNELKLKDDMIQIDASTNSLSFAGMTKRPFDLIKMLAKQSIPTNVENPGYFYYQTKSGFKYVSADTLINYLPYPISYHYGGPNISGYESKDDSNNYKIGSLIINQDQNLISQIKAGVYATKTITFNPANYNFTELLASVESKNLCVNPKFSTLGTDIKFPKILKETLDDGNKFHRIETAVLNVGSNIENSDPNNKPQHYMAKVSTRYNMLFSQKYAITIPCNTDLEAGNVLDIKMESISDGKEQGVDQKQSGKYIIESLCHYFESEKATTNINLIRDSYGLHSSDNDVQGQFMPSNPDFRGAGNNKTYDEGKGVWTI